LSIADSDCRFLWWRIALLHNAYALADFHNLIGWDILKPLNKATGPADLDKVGFGGGAETEVESEVALGDVASAAADFLSLGVVARTVVGIRSDCDRGW